MKNDLSIKNNNFSEHIMVCLSASPSNAKIINEAHKMSVAFKGTFTALYVQTSISDKMSDEDKSRLQYNIALAEKLSADVVTVYGEDVPEQIAEFARISGVTKIVIGRTNSKRRRFWNKQTLVEKLTGILPDSDIYIIPDTSTEKKYKNIKDGFARNFIPHPKDLLVTGIILTVVTLIGMLFLQQGFTEPNIITVYLLGALLTALFTRGYTCSIIGSVLSVMMFNFFLTEPRLTFHAYGSGYPVTFAIMLAASIITSTLASKLKDHAKLSAQSAFRVKVLFETNKLLQKAQDDEDIINITASQLTKLLNKDIIIYPNDNGVLSQGHLFSVEGDVVNESFFTKTEQSVAEWVFQNKHRAGNTTDVFKDANCLYYAIHINNNVHGVVGIHTSGTPIDSYESSILLSILGECALAIENIRNAKEKEHTALLAKNEQLRANLLRSISHDLRTPLTSISGNSSNLLTNSDKMDQQTKEQVYSDIFDDSQWLINLVENLLSVSRIEEGKINLNMSVELMDEVVEEALQHINRGSDEHNISVDMGEELLLVRMDAKLIVQVLINIINNAIKYTPFGSDIKITAQRSDKMAYVSVSDNGPGIPDEIKPKVFDMFFSGNNKIGDSRRSMGLGLSLCKSIITAHGGEIKLTDNNPQGCVFTFSLPIDEVSINE